MVSLQEGIRNFIDSVECQILANNPFVNGSALRLRPEAREVFNERIVIARRIRGCDPTEDPEPPPPPFEGGQCEQRYLITGTYQTGPTGNPSTAFAHFLHNGPIGGFVAQGSGVGLISRGGSQNTSSSGTNPFNCGNNPGAPGPFQYRQLVSGARNPTITSITPCGNDDCGSLPPVYPPPININIEGDVTYNIEGDTEVTVTIPFIFAPINIAVDGTLSIPFSFELGGVNLTGNFTLAPEVNVTINPPRMPSGEGQDTEDFEPSPPEETVEPREPEQKIIGVVVQAQLVGEQQLTTIAQQNIPTIFAPRAGSIKFAYSFGATTFWSDDIDLKGARSFIPTPFSLGADAVAVSPAPGVVVDWVEIVGSPLVNQQFFLQNI